MTLTKRGRNIYSPRALSAAFEAAFQGQQTETDLYKPRWHREWPDPDPSSALTVYETCGDYEGIPKRPCIAPRQHILPPPGGSMTGGGVCHHQPPLCHFFSHRHQSHLGPFPLVMAFQGQYFDIVRVDSCIKTK